MRVPLKLSVLATLVLGAVGCGDYASTAGPEHCGQVGDEVWGKDLSPHDVTCDVTVTGNLVIGPDARVRFAPGTTLVVQGSLSVEGTDGQPVRFEAAEEDQGWVGVWVRAADGDVAAIQRPDPDSVPALVPEGDVSLTNLTIDGAGLAPGGDPFEAASLIIDRGPVNVNNVTINNSRQCGLTLGEYGRLGHESTGLTITEPLEAPICAHAQAVSTLPVDGVDLPEDGTIDVYGQSVTGTHTWPKRGVPYVLKDTLQVARADLTVAAGAELRIYPEVALTVGGTVTRLTYGEKKNRGDTGPLVLNESARLHLAGTAGEPVVISASPDFGEDSFFDRIEIIGDSGSGAAATALLEHVDISRGGAGVTSDPATLSIEGDADVTLSNVTIRDGGGAGILLTDDGLINPASTGVTVTGNAYPAVVEPDGAAGLPSTDSTYTGNNATPQAGTRAPGDLIYVTEGAFTRSGTVPDVGVPYLFEDDVDLIGAPDLLLNFGDGVDIAVAPGAEVDLGSSGSAAVVFGTDGGSGVTMRAADAGEPWGRLVLGSSLVTPSALHNLTVQDAGASASGGAVRLLANDLLVDGLTIDGGADVGLEFDGTMAAGSKNLVVRNAAGIAVVAQTDNAGTIPGEGADLASNGGAHVLVEGSRITVDTSWADLGVPYHVEGQVRVLGREDGDGNPFPARLALEPGVTVLFESRAGLTTDRYETSSSLQTNGTVDMRGTAESPVTLGAVDPELGWGNLHLYYENDLFDPADRSVLDHVVIKDAAAIFGFGSLEMWDSTPTLSNITIDHSFRYGIGLQRDSFVGPRSGDPIEYGCDLFDRDVFTFVGDFGELITPEPEDPFVIDFRIWLLDCDT